MDTTTLTEALRALEPAALTWKFALYATRKGRDGLELEWNLCNLRGGAGQADIWKEYLLKKPVAEKPVAAYSPFLSDKESIAALDAQDELICDQISDLTVSIRNGQAYPPEDYISGVLPKPAGYALLGERRDEDGQVQEQVVLMRRGNPFLTGGAARLFTGAGDTLVSSEKPILKLAPGVDFVLIGGVCYFLSSPIEKDFSLENRHIAIAQRRMRLISDADIVSDYEQLEQAAFKGKNARKFMDFDKSILAHIARMPISAREDFLSTYGVTIDPSGRMDTSDSEQCELVIDLLCCRSCLDPLGRLSVGSNITPRE